MIEITMPRLSDTMEEGAIANWHKKPGDTVEIGDILVEIETDKATMDYEAYEAGTLSKILAQEGDMVAIGQPIALLDNGTGDETPAPQAGEAEPATAAGGPSAPEPAGTASAAAEPAAPEKAAPQAAPATVSAEVSQQQGAARRISSPLVRKIARENGLDLTHVQGTGPGGRIIRKDLDALLAEAQGRAASAATNAAAAAPTGPSIPARGGSAAPATSAADEKRGTHDVPMTNIRRVIARRLGESARTIPHFFVTASADAEEFMRLRGELNTKLLAAGRPKVSVNDLLIRAVAIALREHPNVNASYVGDDSPTMQIHDRINIGVAVAAESGLVVPVITDADQKTVTQLGVEAKKLIGLAGDKKLSPEQMSGGTFTISNLGMYGVEDFTAIINPPEGAILAIGGTKKEPVVVGDEIVAHYVMRYTMSSDHRIIDGALAAQFLKTLTGLIENPWTILA
ncbi:MAG TPA: dihydrolipoamide acetyltransferase family protein [Microbacteriaceae bacterium]|nr:dihydrolipoamide acetyltransferase family protein [Microbacteriaceae bacterium]